jgi:hypothetical protein
MQLMLQVFLLWRANRTTIFSGRLTNNSSTTIVPLQSYVGVAYGITAYSGIWTVDINKTGATERVTIVAVDFLNNGCFFKFLEGAIEPG